MRDGGKVRRGEGTLRYDGSCKWRQEIRYAAAEQMENGAKWHKTGRYCQGFAAKLNGF